MVVGVELGGGLLVGAAGKVDGVHDGHRAGRLHLCAVLVVILDGDLSTVLVASEGEDGRHEQEGTGQSYAISVACVRALVLPLGGGVATGPPSFASSGKTCEPCEVARLSFGPKAREPISIRGNAEFPPVPPSRHPQQGGDREAPSKPWSRAWQPPRSGWSVWIGCRGGFLVGARSRLLPSRSLTPREESLPPSLACGGRGPLRVWSPSTWHRAPRPADSPAIPARLRRAVKRRFQPSCSTVRTLYGTRL
jgi:hypothetical protein